jgi:hypothetical protein
MATQAPIHFYGIARNGKVLAEQLITRGDDGKLAWCWTGLTFRTQREAIATIEAKNLAISKERYA